jgi:predicted dehydrogenase
MDKFRFAIMGAGNIARHFCDAVSKMDDCVVCAVASKSIDRAYKLADECGIDKAYDSYEKMLDDEKPDCAYIAVTPNDHFRLTKMCVDRGIPVLCEKAMFQNSTEAKTAFKAAAERHVFVMEALWSKFLPAVKKAKEWIADGMIGEPQLCRCNIGFIAPKDDNNRYFCEALGGGAAKDITVYAYELVTYLIDQKIVRTEESATWGKTGVDLSDHVMIDFEHTLADIMTSFVVSMDDEIVVYGDAGKLVLPNPHYASECLAYDEEGKIKEHFVDKETDNGFVYEIADVISCVRAGRTQSEVSTWAATIACAEEFDRINKDR